MTIQWTLFYSALLSLLAAGLYEYLGRQLWRRQVSSNEARFAWQLFIVWWMALGATTLITALLQLSGALGFTDLALFVALTYVNILLVCVALWGLLYYLLYLFTGKNGWLIPLSLFYVLYYFLLVYYITASKPDHVEVTRWTSQLVYRQPLTGPLFTTVLVLLVFPQIIGSLAYLTLLLRVREPTQKYRIILVSGSILVWFGSAFLASVAGLAQQDWWQLATRIIGLGAATTVLFAYLPPAWINKRLHVASIDDD